MSIPLLAYSPKSQNQRVASYEIKGEEQPKIYTSENILDNGEIDELIWAAYRQIFNEQQILKFNRLTVLESQLRHRQITIRDFIRGLMLSKSFRQYNYETNNNYRLVQMCVQRLLGRDIYNDQEKLAWSIVIANKGFKGFIDDLLNSEEYLDNFGYDTIPYQRRRILPQQVLGELPFARMPRYGSDYLQVLKGLGYFEHKPIYTYRWQWQRPPYPFWLVLIGKIITFTGGALLTIGIIAVALAAWGFIKL